MPLVMHSKVVKIGNSQGIRIPRVLLEQAGLTGDVEMTMDGNKLIIQSAFAARKDWEAQFAAMAEQGYDGLLDAPTPTAWEEESWTW